MDKPFRIEFTPGNSSEQKVEALILHASCVSEAVKIFHKLFPDHHFVSATESQDSARIKAK